MVKQETQRQVRNVLMVLQEGQFPGAIAMQLAGAIQYLQAIDQTLSAPDPEPEKPAEESKAAS